MDENTLNIGDTVAESGVGPGVVDGFDRNGYPMVNGQAVGRLTRTDGKRFGGSAGTLGVPDNAGPKREPVVPVSVAQATGTPVAPVTQAGGLTTVHPVPAPTAAPEPPPVEPTPAAEPPSEPQAPAEAPSEAQVPAETPEATPVATQAAEAPSEAPAPSEPAAPPALKDLGDIDVQCTPITEAAEAPAPATKAKPSGGPRRFGR